MLQIYFKHTHGELNLIKINFSYLFARKIKLFSQINSAMKDIFCNKFGIKR